MHADTAPVTWGPKVLTSNGWYIDSEQPKDRFSITCTHGFGRDRFVLGEVVNTGGKYNNRRVVGGFDSLQAAMDTAEREVAHG
ncbi:hypothetical protein [Stenotrophomonas sp. MMGLT7]|uniref:hypothetical protein n=1 Tax=Stenotrophomonas sp. MMGLT7 TaxID=2901227 RepID=UPI001E2DFBCA|nr:hypothetical protein [Stenotrophomonas sp. MMGLT7]MCD7096958.1 hypothetical protein [Stenotrophomonas sp. MMGLT7]